MTKTKIGILLSVCSRGQNYRNLGDTDLISIFMDSWYITKEDRYDYHFFIGYDDDDEFYLEHAEDLTKRIPNCKTTKLEGCQGNPCKAWNDLLKKHHKDADYFYQVGTDIRLLTRGWTTYFINNLKRNKNVGMTGGSDKAFWYARAGTFKQGIIENGFFHRTHYDIFGYLFHPSLKNWYSDDYISEIYYNNRCCFLAPYVLFRNTNRVLQQDMADRYIPDMAIRTSLNGIIKEDSEKIKKYLESKLEFL